VQQGDVTAAPEITAELRELGRGRPGGQIWHIDPEFDPDGAVPGWGIRGEFAVGADGELDGSSWTPNPAYRPGPQALGFPPPGNRLERALQLVAARYRLDSELLDALAAAEVAAPTSAGHPDSVPVVDEAGRPTVVLFTAAGLVPPGTPHLLLGVRSLLPMLPTVSIRLNPGHRPSARVSGARLAHVLTR
jgi:hypothetical protein